MRRHVGAPVGICFAQVTESCFYQTTYNVIRP